jgi:hypothetical protein
VEHDDVAWSGRTWRMPPWLWLSLAAMTAGTLHILLDAGVGLFPARGTLAPMVAAALLLIALVHAWWGILGLGWTLLANGSAIAYCPPRCPQGAPLTDVAHVGSIVFGIAAPAAAIWALWRRRARGGTPMGSISVVDWALPAVAVMLVVATIWAIAGAAVEP